MSTKKVSYATGRRKSSVARVYVTPGKGKIVVNDRDVNEYFPHATLVLDLKQPLTILGVEGKQIKSKRNELLIWLTVIQIF